MYHGKNSNLSLYSDPKTADNLRKHYNYLKGIEFEIEDEEDGVRILEIGVTEGTMKTLTLGENCTIVGT